MPRENPVQTSWTKGEVSPLAAGRVDVSLYSMGAKTIENLIVRPQGPVFRRSGTKFIRSTKFPTQQARIIPFTVSDEVAYELEFGAGYIHFYKNKEPLFETTTTEIEEWTVLDDGGLLQIVSGADYRDLPGWGDLSFNYGAGAGPSDNGTATQSAGAGGKVRITTSIPHTLRTGAVVQANSGGADPNSINNTIKTVTRISAYAVDLDSTVFVSVVGVTDTAIWSHGLLPGDRVYFSAYTAGPTAPSISETFQTVKSLLAASATHFTLANVAYSAGVPVGEEAHVIPIEVITTFTETELNDIHYVQSADVLYLFHPDHKPQKLTRLDDDGDRNDWLLADVDFRDGPYLPLNDLSPNIDTTTPANGAIYRDVYFEISSYAHTATATVASGGTAFDNADDNKYIEYRSGDQWRLAQLGTLAGGETSAPVTIIDNVLLYLDEATRLQTLDKQRTVAGSIGGSPIVGYRRDGNGNVYAVARNSLTQRIDPKDELSSTSAVGGGVIAAGTIRSQFNNTFAASDVGKFVRIHDSGRSAVGYWVQITGVSATTSATGGSTATHAQSVAMASNNADGKFTISAESRTATVKSFRTGAAFSAFASTDVGRLMRLSFGGRLTWGKITAYTSVSQVTVTFYEDMPRDSHNAAVIAGNQNVSVTTTGITYDWRMGAWSATTGYPAVGTFHEQRLWFANTETTPQTLWGSISGDFENMSPTELDSTVLDDSAITVTLGSTKANAIKWLVSGPAMTIGTSAGEWQMRANSSINEAITPSNVKVVEYTGHGALGRPIPARAGSSILFVDSSGEKVQEVFYSYEKDALDSDDLTVISEHILREHGGAVTSAYQQKPHSIFWVACADGTLAGMTYNKKQEVIAWHHHTIQGGLVEDISVIPSQDRSEDELWMVVKRTINGATARYIEVLEPDYYPASSSVKLAMKFLDSHKYITGFTGTVITGLNYLEGATVVVVKDGTRITGTFTVASGAITISAGATTELLVGLNGNADLVSLPPEGGSQFGTSQGQEKRLVYMDTRFYNTMNVSFGPNITGTLIAKTLPVVSPTVWFTGTDRLTPAHGYDIESSWAIRQSEPYPLNILFVVAKLETNE